MRVALKVCLLSEVLRICQHVLHVECAWCDGNVQATTLCSLLHATA